MVVNSGEVKCIGANTSLNYGDSLEWHSLKRFQRNICFGLVRRWSFLDLRLTALGSLLTGLSRAIFSAIASYSICIKRERSFETPSSQFPCFSHRFRDELRMQLSTIRGGARYLLL